MKRSATDSQSLDMLLDTMCNTFGGICFITLLVALISASLPKSDDSAESEVGIDAASIADREIQELVLRRDKIKAAIAMHEAILASNSVQNTISESAASYATSISSNRLEIAKLREEREKLEDEITKTTTSVAYNTKEYERLKRVVEQMEVELRNPQFIKKRKVRTPLEREIANLHSVDLWLRHGRLYLIDFYNQYNTPKQVIIVTHGSSPNITWDVSLLHETGWELSEEFYEGREWREILRQLDASGYARIFSDEDSFPQLCELRDAFIHFRKRYNWHIRDDDTLHFVQGYDGRVQ